MAIFGSLTTIRGQLAQDPRFASALAYLAEMLEPGSAARARLNAIAVGVTEKIPLEGGAFALEQVYLSKPRSEVFFETHRKYIDVQAVLAGEESMEVVDLSRLTVNVPYDAERDLIKYLDYQPSSVLRAREGELAVFFPVDGHLSRAVTTAVIVRKTVVKVPVG